MKDNKRLQELADIIKAVAKYEGKIPNVWMHGHTDWEFNEKLGIYVHVRFSDAPKEFCLGDRYVYFSNQGGPEVYLRGSSSDNWHGYDFDYDLKSAAEWVQQAEFKDLKWYLWSGLK